MAVWGFHVGLPFRSNLPIIIISIIQSSEQAIRSREFFFFSREEINEQTLRDIQKERIKQKIKSVNSGYIDLVIGNKGIQL